MNQFRTDIPSAKWHTCVTTVKCDAINEYVSIMVKNNWMSICTWYKQFKDPVQTSLKRKPDKKTRRKIDLCQGPLCSYVVAYRDELIKGEQEVSSVAS